ncbi:S-layer homology domain-containing protein, partial [Clostridiaceae bacterium OttesenSCG-928-D20]|nr:S-layer homology domain-containing protein [Clostridiaceae bacterium OttesenSCG-928-D20]
MKKIFKIAVFVFLLCVLSAVAASAQAAVVAKIGDDEYDSLEAAVAAVEKYETIVLQTDIISTKDLKLQFPASCTLDLNGKNITRDTRSGRGNATAVRVGPLFIGSRPTVIIKNGYINFIKTSLDSSDSVGVNVEDNTDVILRNIIIGGSLSSNLGDPRFGMFASGTSTVFMDGVTIYPITCAVTLWNDSQLTLKRATLVRYRSENWSPRILFADGGNFSLASDSAAYAYMDSSKSKNTLISESALNMTEFSRPSYQKIVVNNRDSQVIVSRENRAPIFTTLNDALKNAQDGDVITINYDISRTVASDYKLSGKKNITIDFNTYMIEDSMRSTEDPLLTIENCSNITIKNGFIDSKNKSFNYESIKLENTSDVEFNNMVVTSTADYALTVQGSVTIDGGRYTGAKGAIDGSGADIIEIKAGYFDAVGENKVILGDVKISEDSFTRPRKWDGKSSFIAENKSDYEAWNRDFDEYFATLYDALNDTSYRNRGYKSGELIGTTIELIKDVSVQFTGETYVPFELKYDMNLELNGHTIHGGETIVGGKYEYCQNAPLAIKDSNSTISNGTIKCTAPDSTEMAYSAVTVYTDYLGKSKVIFENLNIEITNDKGSNENLQAIYVNNENGASIYLEIIGGEFFSEGYLLKTNDSENLTTVLYEGSFTAGNLESQGFAKEEHEAFITHSFDADGTYIGPASLFDESGHSNSGGKSTFKLINYGGFNAFRVGENIKDEDSYYATIEDALNAVPIGGNIHVINANKASYPMVIETSKSIGLTFPEQFDDPGNVFMPMNLYYGQPIIEIKSGDVHLYDSNLQNLNWVAVEATGSNSRLTFSGGELRGWGGVISAENGAYACPTGEIIFLDRFYLTDAKAENLTDMLVDVDTTGYAARVLTKEDNNYTYLHVFPGIYKIDGTNDYFPSLSDAYGKAEDGDTILLMQDVVLEKATEAMAGDKNITLDLQGHTITRIGDEAKDIPNATLSLGTPDTYTGEIKQLTIKNGIINNEQTLSQRLLFNGSVETELNYAIAVLNGNVVLENVQVESAFVGLFAETTINDYKSTVEIKDCSITAVNCLYASGDKDVNIKILSGEFIAVPYPLMDKGSSRLPVFRKGNDKAAFKDVFTIVGSYYSDKDNPFSGDSYYLYVEDRKEARIGDVQYSTVGEALEAVKEGETITLNHSQYFNQFKNTSFKPKCDFTLDLGGRWGSGLDGYEGDQFVFKDSEFTVTVKNGSFAAEGAVLVAEGNTELNIINCKLDSNDSAAVESVEEVKISKSTFTTAEGEKAIDAPDLTYPVGELLTPTAENAWKTAQKVKVGVAKGVYNITQDIIYSTLQEAVGAAANGDYLQFLGGEEIKIDDKDKITTIDKNLTIDFQGFRYSGTGLIEDCFLLNITGNVEVEIRNANIDLRAGVGIEKSGLGGISVENGAKLTITSGTIFGADYAVYPETGAELIIETGVFSGGSAGIFNNENCTEDQITIEGKPDTADWFNKALRKLTVTELLPLSSLEIAYIPDFEVTEGGGTITPSVAARDADGDILQDVTLTWSFDPAAAPAGISYGENGEIDVSEEASSAEITITVSSGNISHSRAVKIIRNDPRAFRIEIAGEDSLSVPTLKEGPLGEDYSAKLYDQFGDQIGSSGSISIKGAAPANVFLRDNTLYLSPQSEAGSVVLSSTIDGFTGELEVTITKAASEVTDVGIYCGDERLYYDIITVDDAPVVKQYREKDFDQYGKYVGQNAVGEDTFAISDGGAGIASIDENGNATYSKPDDGIVECTLTVKASNFPIVSIPVYVQAAPEEDIWEGIEVKEDLVYGARVRSAIELPEGKYYYVGDPDRVLNVGGDSILLKFEDGDGNVHYRSFPVDVEKCPVVLSPKDVTAEYGADFDFDFDYTGAVNTSHFAFFKVEYECDTLDNLTPGDHPFSISSVTDLSGNYDLSISDTNAATLKITKSSLTLLSELEPIVLRTHEYYDENLSMAKILSIYDKVEYSNGETYVVSAWKTEGFSASAGSYTWTAVLQNPPSGSLYEYDVPSISVIVEEPNLSWACPESFTLYLSELEALNYYSDLHPRLPKEANQNLNIYVDGIAEEDWFYTKNIIKLVDLKAEVKKYFEDNKQDESAQFEVVIEIKRRDSAPSNILQASLERKINLTIYNKTPVIVTVSTPRDITYGELLDLVVPVASAAKPLPEFNDWKISYISTDGGNYNSENPPTDPGKYKLVAIYDEEGFYGEGESGEFSIKKIVLDSDKLKLANPAGNFVYNGSEHRPKLLYDGRLIDQSRLEIVYSDNINVGTASVTLVPLENSVYTGSAEISFEISKAELFGDQTYSLSYSGAKENSGSINLHDLIPADCGSPVFKDETSNGNGLKSYSLKDGALSIVTNVSDTDKTQTLSWTVSSTNYKDFKLEIIINIVAPTAPSLEAATRPGQLFYGQSLGNLTLSAKPEIAGSLEWERPETLPEVGTDEHGWVFTPETDDYLEATGKIDVVVVKALPSGNVSCDLVDEGTALSDVALYSSIFKNPHSLEEVKGTLTWTNDAQTVEKDASYEWTFTPDDDTNYQVVTGTLIPWDSSRAVVTSISEEGSDRGSGGSGAEPEEKFRFTDVSEDDWFYDIVYYVYEKNLMIGTSKTEFSPSLRLSRGMMITILHKMAGEPEPKGEASFTDLKQDWYKKPAAWGYESGIIKGYSDLIFGPEDSILRQDLCVMLLHYANWAGIELPEIRPEYSFLDEDKCSDYAKNAVSTLYRAGIINGRGNGIFDPRGYA